MNIISLLQGKERKFDYDKTLNWWDEKIAPRDNLFTALKSAVRNVSTEWEEVGQQLFDWKDGYITVENERQDKQFRQATKLYVSARFVAELFAKEKDLANSLKSSKLDKDQRITLTNKIQEKVASLPREFNYLKTELDSSKSDLIFICQLFAQEIDWNWVEVPIVAKHKHQESGKVYNLALRKVLTYGEVTPNPTFLENPDEYLKEDVLQSIRTAFEFNREFWQKNKVDNKEIWKKANPDKDFDEVGFIWDITASEVKNDNSIEESLADTDELKTEIIKGESAGLAAVVGIYHALLNQIPDNRVVYSARLETDSKKLKPTGKVRPVEGILAKIQAAIETEFIDTFVMHEHNYNEKKNEVMKLIEGKSFRIKTINSEGIVVGTYPEMLAGNSLSDAT